MGISSKRQQASGGFHSQYHLPSRIPTAAWWASRLPVVGRWSVLVLKEMFSLTNCILHAGRIVAQSLEKSKTHVLLYPLSQLQHAEDLLLRCKGRDILYYYFFQFLCMSSWFLLLEVNGDECGISSSIHLCRNGFNVLVLLSIARPNKDVPCVLSPGDWY